LVGVTASTAVSVAGADVTVEDVVRYTMSMRAAATWKNTDKEEILQIYILCSHDCDYSESCCGIGITPCNAVDRQHVLARFVIIYIPLSQEKEDVP
jgi:hypothetical protein